MADDATKDTSSAPVRRTNPVQFLQEVRREAGKVTWPTWKETWLTTVMVFIMVTIVMVFFAIVDFFLGTAIRMFLGAG